MYLAAVAESTGTQSYCLGFAPVPLPAGYADLPFHIRKRYSLGVQQREALKLISAETSLVPPALGNRANWFRRASMHRIKVISYLLLQTLKERCPSLEIRWPDMGQPCAGSSALSRVLSRLRRPDSGFLEPRVGEKSQRDTAIPLYSRYICSNTHSLHLYRL